MAMALVALAVAVVARVVPARAAVESVAARPAGATWTALAERTSRARRRASRFPVETEGRVVCRARAKRAFAQCHRECADDRGRNGCACPRPRYDSFFARVR